MNFEDLKEKINTHLKAYGFDQELPKNLYAPMAYILDLKGKRMRPILTMLAYQAVSNDQPEKAMNLACALELFHNFTLMHDDIMDRAPLRRGKPAVHKAWNEDIAILSGDAMFAFAMGQLIVDFPEKAARLCSGFTDVALRVCEGQMEDMDFAQEEEVSLDEYIRMICKKTAVLFGGCLSLGAIAGGAEEGLARTYSKFGEALGLAFQLQDDLFDAFPPAGFGKQVGGDIIENKKTFLFLKALATGTAEQVKTLREWYAIQDPAKNAEKVEEVLGIYRNLHIEKEMQARIDDYFQEARGYVSELSKGANFEQLKAYLEVIANRTL